MLLFDVNTSNKKGVVWTITSSPYHFSNYFQIGDRNMKVNKTSSVFADEIIDISIMTVVSVIMSYVCYWYLEIYTPKIPGDIEYSYSYYLLSFMLIGSIIGFIKTIINNLNNKFNI